MVSAGPRTDRLLAVLKTVGVVSVVFDYPVVSSWSDPSLEVSSILFSSSFSMRVSAFVPILGKCSKAQREGEMFRSILTCEAFELLDFVCCGLSSVFYRNYDFSSHYHLLVLIVFFVLTILFRSIVLYYRLLKLFWNGSRFWLCLFVVRLHSILNFHLILIQI